MFYIYIYILFILVVSLNKLFVKQKTGGVKRVFMIDDGFR